MAETTTIRKRRTDNQLAAAKKLPFSDYMGGDGRHVVLSKCFKRWRYWLFQDQKSAEEFATKSCSQGCRNNHNSWFLMPWDMPTRKPRQKKPPQPVVKTAHMALPADVDSSAIEWFA